MDEDEHLIVGEFQAPEISYDFGETWERELQGTEMNDVSRNELLAVLELDSDAGVAAKDALIAGAHFDLWLEPVPAVRLLGICSARKRNLQRRGKPELGFAECIADLAERGEQGLLVAYMNDRERGGYYFQLFLEPDPLKVIGCVAVGTSPGGDSATGHA